MNIRGVLNDFQIAKRGVLNFLFPPFCPICGRKLKERESLICERCYENIKTITPPFCKRCGAPLKKGEKGCKYCSQENFYFSTVRGLGFFTPPLSEMIHLLKYERKTKIAERLGILMGNLFRLDPALSDTNIILPVRLHASRLRESGYNQSQLLAEEVSEITGKEIMNYVVIRKKPTKSQTTLSHKEREENLKNAFKVVSPESIFNKTILVVDDVMTTGTTLNELAKILKEEGAKQVYGLVLARAI